MDDLIRKWVWMETMNYALGIIRNENQRFVYPDYDSSRGVPYDEFLKNIFTHALENWPTISAQGSCSGHNRLSIGYWFDADSKGAFGKYKDTSVEISWTVVKNFIKKMIGEAVKDRQIDLLELLAEAANGTDKPI